MERDPKLRLLLGEIPPEEAGMVEIGPGLYGTAAFREKLLNHPLLSGVSAVRISPDGTQRSLTPDEYSVDQEAGTITILPSVAAAATLTVEYQLAAPRPRAAKRQPPAPRGPVGRKQWWAR